MIHLLDSNLLQSTPQNRAIMLLRIFSCSEKLKNHSISSGWEEDCKICQKIRFWVEIFIKYEKDHNKTLKIEQIMDENFVEKVFFSDDVMKIFN